MSIIAKIGSPKANTNGGLVSTLVGSRFVTSTVTVNGIISRLSINEEEVNLLDVLDLLVDNPIANEMLASLMVGKQLAEEVSPEPDDETF